MSVLLPAVRDTLRAAGEVTFEVPDPDAGLGRYAGEGTPHGTHRPWSTWTDLADLLGAHLLIRTPMEWVEEPVNPGEAGGRNAASGRGVHNPAQFRVENGTDEIRMTPQRVGEGRVRLTLRAHAPARDPDHAGYGPDGDWARVNKLEDPVFLATFVEALRRVNPPQGGRVLALGVNAGHELDALPLAFPDRRFEVVGVDLDPAAAQAARDRWPQATIHAADVNALPPDLGRFDLILALSLLQSPGVRQDVLLSTLRRHHLTPGGGLILGYPNARYRDGTLSYGARMRNYARPDLSLLAADVTNARRGLQKHDFKVFVTGKYEVLLTAIPAHGATPTDLEL